MQLGPTIRMPAARAMVRRRCSLARPWADTSAKPAEMTTTARTPHAAHSLITASTAAEGTVMIARSTAAPTAATDG